MKARKNLTIATAVRNCFRAGSFGTGAALLALSGAAHAADSAATLDAIQVTGTGIRAAIESAIATKRDSDAVVEAITAEDIGKLPDTTIAESLARLPGVTAQRDSQGNATNINIRGLGPDFNGYLLNGREQTSTGDSRAVDLSVYPAELIGGATIYKTTDASLATAGLAGTIDNHLIDPLAIGHRVISVSDEKTKNNVGNPITGSGKRYGLAYIDQFADRKLGVAVGYVHADGVSNTLTNGSWGNNSTVTTTGGATSTVSVPFGGGMDFESQRNNDRRNGLAAILAYKPNKDFSTEVDYYHAQINTALKKTALKGGTFGAAITNATITNGVVTAGTIAMPAGNFIGYSENIFDDDTLKSLGWKTTMNLGDGWTGTLDLNHNSAKRVEKDIEAYAHTTTADTLSFTNGGAAVPSFSFGNPSLYTNSASFQISDQSGWSGVSYPASGAPGGNNNRTVPQAGYMKGPTIIDTVNGGRVDFHKSLSNGGVFSDVSFGLNTTRREKDRYADEGLIIANDGTGGYSSIAMPSGAYVANNVGGTGLNLLTFDPTGIWAGAALLPKYNNDILSKTWTVSEKVETAYVKGNVDTKLAGIPVTGNVGAQLVHTQQASSGFRADVGSSVTLTNPAGGLSTAGTSYSDVLPSLNLRGDLGAGNVLRLGLAEQIARPTMTDMRNSMSVALDTNSSDATYNRYVGSAGNPNLKPFKAKTLDLSYEKYFGNKAYLSAAGYYKKLDTYIIQQTTTGYDFTSIASSLGMTAAPLGYIGQMTNTVNGSGGNIRGMEFSASLPFNIITRYLDGFGALASYSTTWSSVVMPNLVGLNPTQPVVASNYAMSMPGLSKTNDKVEVYFERWGFSTFWAVNHRSQYVGSVANTTVGGYPALINIGAQTWVSAQAGYEFQKGYLKGLAFRFEANNMNKPIYREFKADGSPNTTNQTGASYGMRVSYKFE